MTLVRTPMGCRPALRLTHCDGYRNGNACNERSIRRALRDFGVWGRTDAPYAGVVA